MWGGNNDGKCGASLNQKSLLLPTLIQFTEKQTKKKGKLIKITCGTNHSMALTNIGFIYSWGSNRFGQLGRNKQSNDNHPEIIPSLHDIISIDCGFYHSGAVDKNGKIYTWGLAQNGSLGHENSFSNENLPKQIQSLNDKHISLIQCGEYLTSCIDSKNGEIYYTGILSSSMSINKMIKIDKMVGVNDLYCSKSRIICLIRSIEVLLQRHTIEGNFEPFQAIINYLSKSNPNLYSNLSQLILEGENLLHLACLSNQPRIVEYILFKSIQFDILAYNNSGKSPIHICAELNHYQSLKYLLLHADININQKDQKNGNSALHYAVLNNHIESVQILVQFGCEKSIFNNEGFTPLHISCKNNFLPISQFLVCNAASIDDKDHSQQTPLGYLSWRFSCTLRDLAEENEVFISYAHVDYDFALKIRKSLNCLSLRCWMDDWRLGAGSDWRTAIGKGLMNAKIVIFIASNNSVISDWCLKELYLAKELQRKVIIVKQNDFSDNIPILDIHMATLLNSKSKDIFDFSKIDWLKFDDDLQIQISYNDVLNKLARRTNGLLEYFHTSDKFLIQNSNNNVQEKLSKKKFKNSNRHHHIAMDNSYFTKNILSKKSLYVYCKFLSSDSTFISWIQSHLKTHRITSFLSIPDGVDERMFVSNIWVYILVVSSEILKSDVVQQHLKWIEQNNVHLILLYFDADNDYMDLFPKEIFTNDQIQKLSDLFSFCISDPPWIDQLMYTLNLLRKQTLLDRHLDMLMKRIENYRQQAHQLDANIETKPETISTNLQTAQPLTIST